MLMSWPLHSAHPEIAKVPANRRISPRYGSAIYGISWKSARPMLVTAGEDAIQANEERHTKDRLNHVERLAASCHADLLGAHVGSIAGGCVEGGRAGVGEVSAARTAGGAGAVVGLGIVGVGVGGHLRDVEGHAFDARLFADVVVGQTIALPLVNGSAAPHVGKGEIAGP